MTTAAVARRDRLYRASPGRPELVEVPAMSFVMVDGRGDPNTATEYRDAIQVLYSVAYTLRYALKRELGVDERVGPLEGLWWTDDMADFGVEDKSGWKWTMMIVEPEALTPERFAAARDEVIARKGLAAASGARLERFDEGLCAQVLHVGPYSAEGPTIARLHAFIAEQGLGFDGRLQKHHEIYLSDPRRVPPERWRTIVRQPVSRSR